MAVSFATAWFICLNDNGSAYFRLAGCGQIRVDRFHDILVSMQHFYVHHADGNGIGLFALEDIRALRERG